MEKNKSEIWNRDNLKAVLVTSLVIAGCSSPYVLLSALDRYCNGPRPRVGDTMVARTTYQETTDQSTVTHNLTGYDTESYKDGKIDLISDWVEEKPKDKRYRGRRYFHGYSSKDVDFSRLLRILENSEGELTK